MKSVSGKYWEEEKINKRIIEKVKIENNFEDLIARQIISKKFQKEEIYLINNRIDLVNPFLNNDDFIKATELLKNTINNKKKYVLSEIMMLMDVYQHL